MVRNRSYVQKRDGTSGAVPLYYVLILQSRRILRLQLNRRLASSLLGHLECHGLALGRP